jgi:CheY-like chemotaxis protein
MADEKRRRVMVVEDDEGIREALCDLLDTEGFAVMSAVHGADALSKLRDGNEKRPDVILLDLMMPVMDGWSFRAEQRNDPALSQIPVIVITASRQADVASLEPKAFLKKPIDFDELLKAIA